MFGDYEVYGIVGYQDDLNQVIPFITSGVAHSLTIGDKNTFEDFGLTITNWKLKPPEPKTYYIDIPGGDGAIDLTTALTGDVFYRNRSQKFTFQLLYPEDYEKVKTELSNYLHGKHFQYRIDFDPDYVYEGRFSINSYDSVPNKGIIVIDIDADPYKTKEKITFRVNAAGGITVRLPSGRKAVSPIIEVYRKSIVSMGDLVVILGPGTWQIPDLWFTMGYNELYINTYIDNSGNVFWSDVQDQTWESIAHLRWSDIIWDDSIPRADPSWESIMDKTWEEVQDKRWLELQYDIDPATEEYAAYVQYDWKDL